MTDPAAETTGKPALRPVQAADHPRVDSALAELDRIAALAPADQVAGFTAVHRELQETLAEIDGPGPGDAGF